jgi:hypothetical protein
MWLIKLAADPSIFQKKETEKEVSLKGYSDKVVALVSCNMILGQN